MARKRGRQVDVTDLPAAEKERRQRQREMRELALAMRADGKDYSPAKKGSQKAASGAQKPARKQQEQFHAVQVCAWPLPPTWR